VIKQFKIELSPIWSINADNEQWMIRKNGVVQGYIGGTRDTLLRVLREKGAPLTEENLALLNELPPTYLEWRDHMQAKKRDA
jgi:hypothetical protein